MTQPSRFFAQHSLSIASIAILSLFLVLYSFGDPRTHWGSFFGNAIADWTGMVVAIIATKYLYEIGSAESRQPDHPVYGRFRRAVRNHSLTIFLVVTGIAWVIVYARADSESKWGQVAGNIVSEWTQLLGIVLMTKKLIERKSKESRD